VSSSTLACIEVRTGINQDGEGFVTTIAVDSEGRMLLGQLDTHEVRLLALNLLTAAEAADQDGAVLRCIRKLDLPDDLAAAIVTELRSSRGDS
jgi:hypothetical protein